MNTAGVIAMLLALSTGASADTGQWNQFIDHDQKPIAVAPPTKIAAQPAPKQAAAAKQKAPAPAAKAKPKAKASAKRKGR
jgi:hypothetical protein